MSVRTLYPLYALSHLKRPKVGVLNEKRCITLIDRTSGGGHITNMNNDTSKMIIASNHTNPEIKRALKAITNFAKKLDKKNKTRKNPKKNKTGDILI